MTGLKLIDKEFSLFNLILLGAVVYLLIIIIIKIIINLFIYLLHILFQGKDHEHEK
jgi:hypothetical protein